MRNWCQNHPQIQNSWDTQVCYISGVHLHVILHAVICTLNPVSVIFNIERDESAREEAALPHYSVSRAEAIFTCLFSIPNRLKLIHDWISAGQLARSYVCEWFTSCMMISQTADTCCKCLKKKVFGPNCSYYCRINFTKAAVLWEYASSDGVRARQSWPMRKVKYGWMPFLYLWFHSCIMPKSTATPFWNNRYSDTLMKLLVWELIYNLEELSINTMVSALESWLLFSRFVELTLSFQNRKRIHICFRWMAVSALLLCISIYICYEMRSKRKAK